MTTSAAPRSDSRRSLAHLAAAGLAMLATVGLQVTWLTAFSAEEGRHAGLLVAGYLAAATGYLLATAWLQGRLARRGTPQRLQLVFHVAADVLVAAWAVRLFWNGALSRLFAGGLWPVAPILAGVAGASLVALVAALVWPEARSAGQEGGWLSRLRLAAIAGLFLAALLLESRPLPQPKPWEKSAPASRPTSGQGIMPNGG